MPKSLLLTLSKFLKGKDQIDLRLTQVDDQLQLLITSKLTKHDPDTNDPELSVLQAALSRPILLKLPKSQADDEQVLEALSQMSDSQANLQDQLDDFLQKAAADAAKAKEEAAKKEAATKSSSKTTPSKQRPKTKAASEQSSSQANDADDQSSSEEEESDDSNTPEVASKPANQSLQPSLISDLF